MFKPSSTYVDLLIKYYGLYQLIHTIVNFRAITILLSNGYLDFPVPVPAGGWSNDTVSLMVAIAFVDLIGALLSLIFVWNYITQKQLKIWLGWVVLTISVYGQFLYSYWIFTTGAWTSTNFNVYFFTHIAFIPVLILTLSFIFWARKDNFVN